MTAIAHEPVGASEAKPSFSHPVSKKSNVAGVTSLLVHIFVHVFCIGMYLLPVLAPNKYSGPTLDELHIMSRDNDDINGDTTLTDIFQNDYWGRPMQSESSHKSWRPLTVLSFRYLKGIYTSSELTVHRIVNIITHAAAAEVVGVLATRLFVQSTPDRQLLLRMVTKVVFALHPTHVEVTANAANRNHILAVLFSTLLCDPECPLWLFGIALVAGYLASETFLFQVPAAALTLVVTHLHYKRRRKLRNPGSTLQSVLHGYVMSALAVLPRLLFMLLAIVLYLGGRAYFDTLDIPEGLIRPAENPFYHFKGEHRIRNYLYTLSIHVAKSWGMDPIGFSHEYGFDCIPELQDWRDPRLAVPCAIAVGLIFSLVLAFRYPWNFLGPVAIHWAWLLTLFPVSGFVKVGTFVSDRIVVASTVSVSLWIGLALHTWLTRWIRILPARPLQAILVVWIFVVSYLKIHNRSLQWMDSISLMESSLETCDYRFAKALMETSKIYSGLFPELLDLQKSRNYLERARAVDPDMCDLHHQFAIVAVQEGKYLEYEEELTRAVVCPFTMQAALAQWKRYWDVNLNNPFSPAEKARVQQRYDQSRLFIERIVEEEQRRE